MGRGAGWHQFGGLSSPILDWYSSYYLPSSITGGFDLWISKKIVNKNNTELQAWLHFYSDVTPKDKTIKDKSGNDKSANNKDSQIVKSVIVVLNEHYEYEATLDGKS